ncbi:hypothetical protein GBAR_LOCUS636 [Geodia barretti]|uniref:Uncharacterized protein n=1 Tax=Geodia barretti TaxID=519541 RepID=A0AA35QU59_GEOBA|nr:hypothetical protein GBAR_LOCUS636 [Geodia barretti]
MATNCPVAALKMSVSGMWTLAATSDEFHLFPRAMSQML